jgi:type IV pilus assembly protein PilA
MNRNGFTLIELLIVVVIIGILASIAIPQFANTKEKAYIASMKSDLRNLVTAEEAYFADSGKYSATLGAGGVDLNVTSGNNNPTIAVTADGWTASISNVNTTKTCAVYIGTTTLAPAVKEGEPKCQ